MNEPDTSPKAVPSSEATQCGNERRALHSPAPWSIDTIDNEGAYGAGPGAQSGFKSYAVLDASGKCLFDSLNSDVGEVHEEFDEDGIHAWDEVARQNLTLAAAAPGLLAAAKFALNVLRREQDCAASLKDLDRAVEQLERSIELGTGAPA